MKPPPRLGARLLRWSLPVEEHDYVVGDLEEEFQKRQRRDGRGPAVRWYWYEAARSVGSLMTYPGRWRGMTMVGLVQDLRGALRVFRRAPGFAAVVVLTLGIGVGGASAVYSVVRGVLLTPLPFAEPDRVVMLWGQTPDYPRTPLTVGDHNALANDVEAFSHVAAAWSNTTLLLGGAEAEQVSMGWVTPEYFDMLGVFPSTGRLLAPDDVEAVVLSHDLWVRRYGADPGAVGRIIDLGGDPFEIAGVVRPDQDPNLTTFGGGRAAHDLWRLQPPEWTRGDDRSVGWLRTTARLRAGVSLTQAQAEVDALFAEINPTVPDRDGGADLRVHLIPVKSDLVGDVSRTLWILLGAVCGVLLIAASNVAHLMLARGEARTGEVSVRMALGGSRGRLVRQLLVESGVLALAGGVLGIGLASLGVPLLLSMAPPTLPRLDSVQLDWGVFAFALAATAIAAVVFALAPALRSGRTDLSEALGDRRVTSDAKRQRLSRSLVVAEVALSLALVTSTGLLIKSLAGLSAVDLGFERTGVVTFAMEAPEWGDTGEEAAATMTAFEERFHAVPGVQAVGFTNRVPLGGGIFTGTFRSEEMVAADESSVEASVRYVTPGYLETLGARLIAGRTFRTDDGVDRVLVDETAAERAWPGENPVGRMVETSTIGGDASFAEIIGVVGAMKHHGVAERAEETLYVPMLARAHQQNFRYAAVRVQGDPNAVVEGLRAAAREVDGNAVVARVRTLDDLFADDVSATRFATLLLTIFGGVALLLATVGLHGVMAYSVRRRTREIGIRVVLGAEHGEILRGALRTGATLVAAGIGVGTLLSLASGRLLGSVLFGVDPGDLATLLGSATVMAVVGLLGAYLPARLVLGVDPAVALRED